MPHKRDWKVENLRYRWVAVTSWVRELGVFFFSSILTPSNWNRMHSIRIAFAAPSRNCSVPPKLPIRSFSCSQQMAKPIGTLLPLLVTWFERGSRYSENYDDRLSRTSRLRQPSAIRALMPLLRTPGMVCDFLIRFSYTAHLIVRFLLVGGCLMLTYFHFKVLPSLSKMAPLSKLLIKISTAPFNILNRYEDHLVSSHSSFIFSFAFSSM